MKKHDRLKSDGLTNRRNVRAAGRWDGMKKGGRMYGDGLTESK